MSITTRYGDRGRTQLYSGEDVSKAHLRTEAVGSLDEAVSVLGIARSLCVEESEHLEILDLQRSCFVVGSEIATESSSLHLLKERVDQEFLDALERRRGVVEARVAMPSGFVLPGGTPVAAHLDHARCLFRRCERCVVRLWEEGLVENELLLQWLNRVSDYLWLFARYVEGGRVIEK